MSLDRIIPVEDLPPTLWDRKVLRLSPCLAAAYRAIVNRDGLGNLANARDSSRPPVGGVTEADARKHFAQAFDGSAARAALALIDPKAEVCRVADAFVTLFAGGRVAVLDVPCGAGAFFLSTLSAIAELRQAGVIPRLPLDVMVLGGDINHHATRYATDLRQHLTQALQRQAIFVDFIAMNWDVCDAVSTADLLKRFLKEASTSERHAVVISNFSGFLKSSGNWKKAEPQLTNVFLFCAGEKTSAVWLEPQTNAATKTLRGKLLQGVKEKWASFMGLFGRVTESDAQEQTEAEFALPLKPGATSTARLAVMRFEFRKTRT